MKLIFSTKKIISWIKTSFPLFTYFINIIQNCYYRRRDTQMIGSTENGGVKYRFEENLNSQYHFLIHSRISYRRQSMLLLTNATYQNKINSHQFFQYFDLLLLLMDVFERDLALAKLKEICNGARFFFTACVLGLNASGSLLYSDSIRVFIVDYVIFIC